MVEYGKPNPNVGENIPDKYKVSMAELDRRLQRVEKTIGITPTIPKSFGGETTMIEYNGFIIYRDLSLGLYKILDLDKNEIPLLSNGVYNQLDRCKATIDNYISAQKITEDRGNRN